MAEDILITEHSCKKGEVVSCQGIQDKVTIGYGAFPQDDKPYAALKGKRDDIIKLLEAVLKNQRDQNLPELGFTITMPCGCEQVFKELRDIPIENLLCPCGNPGHIMIKLLQYTI